MTGLPSLLPALSPCPRRLSRVSHSKLQDVIVRTPLANSPDWLKAAPMRENLLASWRQSGQKQDPCPSLLNHNAKYKRLLPPYCDFANGVRSFDGHWFAPLRACPGASESTLRWRGPVLVRNGAGLACRNDRRCWHPAALRRAVLDLG